MKLIKNKNLYLLLVLLFVTQINFGQTYNEEPTNEEQIIENEAISENIFKTLGISTETNPRNALIRGNTVFLTQVGDFNATSIFAQTNASEINVLQNGDVNDIDIEYVANTAIANLVQNGSYNKISDVVFDENANISLDLIQDGSGLIFKREGINSLTESLKFRQTEASPVLIIRSFY